MTAAAERHSAPQLLQVPCHGKATGEERYFLLYLPAGYDAAHDRSWPILCLLRGGERASGKANAPTAKIVSSSSQYILPIYTTRPLQM
jgi:hypothetical protein